MKKIIAVLLAVILTAALASCNAISSIVPEATTAASTDETQKSDSAETVAADTGGDIVLDTVDFEITVPEGYHLAMIPAGSDVTTMIADKNNNIGLMFIKESISDFEGTGIDSLDDYIELQHDNVKGDDVSEFHEMDGLKYFTYTFLNESWGYTYEYFTTATQTDTEYWTMQGFTLQSMYDQYEADFAKWFTSMKFH